MKNVVIFFLLVSSPIFANTNSAQFIQNWLLSTNTSSNWLFTADQYVFSSDDFQKSYLFFVSNLPPEQLSQVSESKLKKQFFDKFITENILVLSASKDGLLKDPKLQSILKMSIVETIYQYYLKSHVPKDQTLFLPTQEEFNRYYAANKDRFNALGLNASQIKQQAYREISNMKIQQWMFTLVEQSRENYKIKRNTNEMKKLNITPDIGH